MKKDINRNGAIYSLIALLGLIILIYFMVSNFLFREYQSFYQTIIDDLYNPIMWVGCILLVIGIFGVKKYYEDMKKNLEG